MGIDFWLTGRGEICRPCFLFLRMLYNECVKMEKIYNIKYVDAYYTYAKSIGKIKLSHHEAYGYVEKNADSLIIFFIKRRGSSSKKTIGKKENIVKGLVIPDKALVSVADTYKTDILKNVKEGMSVAIMWRDMVYVANVSRYDCAIMYTEGVLVKAGGNYFVLKDPETIRIHPKPVENHPVKKPRYYIIPTSLVTEVTVIK